MKNHIWRPITGVVFQFLRATILLAALISFNTSAQTFEPEACSIDGCNECEGGVLSLTLQFDGGAPALIEVIDGNGVRFGPQVVDAGGEVSITGKDGDKLKDPKIFVDGIEDVKIHTSCSQETGPGTVWGSFTVLDGVSKDGGPICPAPECLECKGGVLSLSLTYNGIATAVVEVIDDKETRFGPEFVIPGGTIAFSGADGDKLDGPIILVNGMENTEIHTSCSQPIGPGAIWGLFTVASGISKDNGNICPEPECRECDGGVTALTLAYNGTSDATIQVIDGNGNRFGPETVAAGGEFSIVGKVGDNLKDPKIFIDGAEDVKIHTSCSQETGPGTVWGSFTVVEGVSQKGGRICPAPECLECKGGVTALSLVYDGTVDATIEVIDGNGTRFGPATVAAGGEISISGEDGDNLKDPKIFIDGVEDVKIHTSCSQEVGPGAVWGSFTVSAGTSKDNGNICPAPECLECEGGVVSMSMAFNGDVAAEIQVLDDGDDTVFGPQLVMPDGEISFTAVGDKLKDPILFVNGVEDVKLHTSCSQPIGPGTIWGSFTVTESSSKYNGPICPVDPLLCDECKGGVTKMTMRYYEAGPVNVEVVDDDGITLFGPATVDTNGDISFESADGPGEKLTKDVFIYVNGVENTKLHTSCSQDISPGTVWGSFQVRESFSVDNGPICGCTFPEGSDYGDGPAIYDMGPDGPASHALGGTMFMGTAPDGEDDPQSSADAQGDDVLGIDDEGEQLVDDGEGGMMSLCDSDNKIRQGADNDVSVATTGDGLLNVWVDWNDDGDFEDFRESVVANLSPVGGQATLELTPPSNSANAVFARFRFSSQENLGPTGPAPDGEVEDCRILVDEDDG